jgi:prepilin-type N-terminal cleavage/methylation domain-containing protein
MLRVRLSSSSDTAHPRAGGQAGFTLVEVLVAIVVLTIGLLGTFAALRSAAHTTLTNRERQAETSLAREVLEDAGSLPSWQLTTSGLPAALAPLISGSSTAAGGLTVTRGLTTYSATLSACSIDDPSDGSGSDTSAPAPNRTWCPNLTSSSSTDSTPDNEEKVSVAVGPSAGASGPTVQQSTLIVNRPPVVSGLTVTGSSCTSGSPASCTSAHPLSVTVTTTTPATSILWFVNGSQQASGDPYSTSGTSSQFTWQPPAGAANYTISAQAEYGQGPVGSAATLQVRITS